MRRRRKFGYPVPAAADYMQRPIVFVGGVHGSGKSTLCRRLAELLPAGHVTAGALIRQAAEPGYVVTVGAQDKAVPDLDANQAVLLRGLSAYTARTADDIRPLLLDGHFSLMDPSGGIVDIPDAVFRAIGPVAVLLVQADARTVHERLAARADDPPSPECIGQLAARERQRAIATADALKIPMWVLAGDGSAEQEARSLIRKFGGIVGGVN